MTSMKCENIASGSKFLLSNKNNVHALSFFNFVHLQFGCDNKKKQLLLEKDGLAQIYSLAKIWKKRVKNGLGNFLTRKSFYSGCITNVY